MPKHKKQEESTSDSDSGPDDRGPLKKSKPVSKKPEEKEKSKESSNTESDEYRWNLGKNRFIRLTEFKGKWYVDIREHYLTESDMRPGRKGLMLTMEQWQKLKACMGEVDEAIKKNV